jgi:hypothetical protein
VGNNPLGLVDPTGLLAVVIPTSVLVGALIGELAIPVVGLAAAEIIVATNTFGAADWIAEEITGLSEAELAKPISEAVKKCGDIAVDTDTEEDDICPCWCIIHADQSERFIGNITRKECLAIAYGNCDCKFEAKPNGAPDPNKTFPGQTPKK